MNTITIQLCQEDRDRLDRIIAALERPAPECKNCADSVAEFVDEKLHQAGLAPAPVTYVPQATEDTTPEEKPVEVQETAKAEPEPEQPAVDRAEVQKKVVALSAAGKKKEVRDIVLAYGNTKVSDIPEDKLNEVWQKLTALEG